MQRCAASVGDQANAAQLRPAAPPPPAPWRAMQTALPPHHESPLRLPTPELLKHPKTSAQVRNLIYRDEYFELLVSCRLRQQAV